MSDAWLESTRDVLRRYYREACEARLDLEVFLGERDVASLCEFEHALSHLVLQVLNGGDPDQSRDVASHLRRIILESREYVAETTLSEVFSRLNPFVRHPRLARILLIEPPRRLREYHEEVKQIRELIIVGRRNKGPEEDFDRGNEAFKEAIARVRLLDEQVPASKFNDRAFAILLCGVGIIVGAAVKTFIDFVR